MRPSKLDAQTLEKWLGSHAGWEKAEAGGQEAIARTFKFADFSAAISAMASSEFSSAPAAVAANGIQSLAPTEEFVLRSLLNAVGIRD